MASSEIFPINSHDGGEVDVVICGYGPTGQAAASLLAGMGHSVCVFERFPTLYGMPRLCTLDSEAVRIVQSAGDVEAAFRDASAAEYYDILNADGENLLHLDYAVRESDLMGHAPRTSMYQPDVEDAMDAAARERGAAVRHGWEVVAFEQDEHGVTVTANPRRLPYRATAEGPIQVRGRYLIAADGANSFVRETLGIERQDYGFREAFLSVDAEILRPLPEFFRMSSTTVDPGRTRAYVRIGTKRARFEFLVNPDDDHTELLVPEIGYDFLNGAYGLSDEDVRIYRQVIYDFSGKRACEWQRDRIFLAGDAAHLMPPFLGQGACAGLRDSKNLAWKLDLVLRGVAAPTLLETYGEERSPHVDVHIAGSVMLGQLTCERDPDRAAARDDAYRRGEGPRPTTTPPVRHGILLRDATGEPAGIAGQLGLQARVEIGDAKGLLDDVTGYGFQLLVWEADPEQVLTQSQFEFLRALPCHVVRFAADAAVDTEGRYAAFFVERGVQAVLVRPDFAIFGAAKEIDELGGIVDDLHAQLSGRRTRDTSPSPAIST